MSEAEQNVGIWDTTVAQLSEARTQRDELQAMNLQVTDNLRRTIEERDDAVKVNAAFQIQVASLQKQLQEVTLQRDNASANVDSLRAEYRKAKETANTNSDNVAALREQVQQMTAERDRATAQLEECCEDRSRLNGSANRMIEALQRDVGQWRAERDHATAQWEECCEDRGRQVTSLREQLAEMTAERDAARKFADKLQVDLGYCRCEHDTAREELAQAKEVADMFAAENTSLQDTVRQLRAKQVHTDLSGILMVIQRAAEQARELI